MTQRPDRLMEGLTRLLEGVDLGDGELEARLDEALAGARDLLRADGAGLMLATSSGLACAGASSGAAAALERAQVAIGDGPGIESTFRRKVVSVADLQSDPRWPDLAGHVSEVRAVLSAPIWLRGRPAGNLNLLCHEPREWSRADAQALAAYAGIVTAFMRIALDARHQGDVADALRRHLGDQTSETPSRPT